jgi:hypothetical protein
MGLLMLKYIFSFSAVCSFTHKCREMLDHSLPCCYLCLMNKEYDHKNKQKTEYNTLQLIE